MGGDEERVGTGRRSRRRGRGRRTTRRDRGGVRPVMGTEPGRRPGEEDCRPGGGQAFACEPGFENPAQIKARTASPMTTAPRSGWLVAKNTTATTTSAKAAAISAMVRGLLRICAL